MQTFQAPRWLGPILVLIALALIPIAMMVGLTVLAVVLGFAALRVFLPTPSRSTFSNPGSMNANNRKIQSPSTVIDAEYEVKESNAKN